MPKAPRRSPAGPTQNDIRANKDIAALSYLWILSIAIFLLRRDSPFIRFHAKQGMVLFLASVFVLGIPVVGPVLEFIVFALFVTGFVNAAQGKMNDVPVVGPVSRGEWHAVRASWKRAVDAVGAYFRPKSSRSAKRS